MKNISIFVLCLLSFKGLSQLNEDSIWTAFSYECQQGNETTCIDLGNSIAKHLLSKEGDTAVSYLNGLLKISEVYTQNALFLDAQKLHDEYLLMVGIKYGKTSLEYARGLSIHARGQIDLGNHQLAKSHYFQALEIREEALGREHEIYANSLNNIGILYRDLAVYDSALYFFTEAERVFSIFPEKNRVFLTKVYNNMGNAFADMGKKEQATNSYQKALDLIRLNGGTWQKDYAMTLSNLGNLWFDMGNMKEAEKCYMEAIEIFSQTVGEKHPYYINLQNNLGSFYAGMGDFLAAENYYMKSLASIEKSMGTNHPDYAICLNNLAILYSETKQFEKAHRLQRQTLATIQNVFGDKHMYTLSFLHNLGFIFSQENKLDSALHYYLRSLSICKELYGEEHNEYAVLLHNIAQTHESLDSLELSQIYYEKALSIYANVMGKSHPDYINCEMDYALLQIHRRRFEVGISSMRGLLEVHAKQIASTFEWLSDQQKEGYWKKEKQLYHHIASITATYHSFAPELAAFAFDQALSAKGKLLQAKISQEEYLNALDFTMKEAREKSKELNRLISEGITDKKFISALTEQVDSLNKALTVSWPAYAQKQRDIMVGYKDIQQVLELDELAIEFVRHQIPGDTGYSYFALVLSKNKQFPTVVPLCSEKSLLSLNPRIHFSTYYDLLWKPLESAIKGIKTIYYTPDGLLWQVPFHALFPEGELAENQGEKTRKNRGIIPYDVIETPSSSSDYVMDRFTLIQMNSTRYLAFGGKQKMNSIIGESASMVGGIDYDFVPCKVNTKHVKKEKKGNNSFNFGFSQLPGTYKEVTTIAENLQKKGWEINLTTGNTATEDWLLSKDFSKTQILHLATHGFAIPLGEKVTPNENKLSFVDHIFFHPNPMVRSGLILSGGNWTWRGTDTLKQTGLKENGILTALEVSTMNLRKTRLVVLSACETALGDHQDIEGILGLRRAFKLAGVEELIISLWEVPDKETMELMQLFYVKLNENLVPLKAFNEAQQEMRNKYPDKPHLWAGFLFTL